MVRHGAASVPALLSLPDVDTYYVTPERDGNWMVTVAVADLVESAWETAVTETDVGLGSAEGARKIASFAVPKTVVEMRPLVEFPPVIPLTCHVTAVLLEPDTVAVKGWVASVAIVARLGEMATLT
jgi:hypothetical protein